MLFELIVIVDSLLILVGLKMILDRCLGLVLDVVVIKVKVSVSYFNLGWFYYIEVVIELLLLVYVVE